MKWGLIGYGRIARKFEESIRHTTNHKITAIASRSGHGNISNTSANVYATYEALCEDPEVDIVYVNTTHNTHARHTIAALNAGKHVLCEKPMAVSVKEVEEMVAAARQNQRFLMEAIWSRYLPGYQKALGLIRQGAIGEVRFISAHFGFTMNPNDPKERLVNPELAAGAIWDVGIYPISLAQDIYGNDPTTMEVVAECSPVGVEDRCAMQLTYPNGRVAQLSCAINLTTPNPAMITGTKGSIIMNDFWKCEEMTLNTPDGVKTFRVPFKSTGLYHEAIGVVEHIDAGLIASPLMTWEHSIQLARIMDHAISKARS